MNDQQRLELEAAAFRRLVAHLDSRKDVQNIDLMNLSGFCRNCLSTSTSAYSTDSLLITRSSSSWVRRSSKAKRLPSTWAMMDLVMSNESVLYAEVEVDKPHALRFAESVSITLAASR